MKTTGIVSGKSPENPVRDLTLAILISTCIIGKYDEIQL